MKLEGIREIEIKKDEQGQYKSVRIVFGPHHTINIIKVGKKTEFSIVSTHHGFKADASSVPSELETFIEEIRENHPENRVD
ncbi:hypothetical protein COV12_01715 [Candidatus Woesearchaeota archaeon CG10_big_fil_rev_8_21_14_0_10_32_24]|nr:MAG: hypothetical protein COV12_01715 [Candidatus Woesearchaeota archaeon CG10_big_fil_rev_8_21_14_0_10_32_24]